MQELLCPLEELARGRNIFLFTDKRFLCCKRFLLIVCWLQMGNKPSQAKLKGFTPLTASNKGISETIMAGKNKNGELSNPFFFLVHGLRQKTKLERRNSCVHLKNWPGAKDSRIY
ncbi:hypothetical protein CEXT_793061 [Caerostris extrusa]|uniref:Uncharacterized protein n=1 Tax=Caerostris extrusa TaxID=172846 RepID=A0AAV4VFB0_CAEEX|nr:hypothetical protein CEXT_793061 [Caerostris extrusa]